MKPKKREGTPEKATTPTASQEAFNDQFKSSVISNEEILKLTIQEDDLSQLRENTQSSADAPDILIDVIVQKLKSESERNKPKVKNVKVMKHAPGESRVRSIEFAGGIRVDNSNQIVPHSILGDVHDFLNEAAIRGEVQHVPLPESREPSILSVKYEYVKKSKQREDPLLSEDNALKNWQNKMLERKKQQGFISRLVDQAPNALIMNRGDKIRRVVEEKDLIDRTIPYVGYGKGYRTGSEFWTQQELFGDDVKGIHMSLTQTEKGYPPVVEHIGIPDVVQTEKNVRPVSASSTNHPWNIGRPWSRSQYLCDRKSQLSSLMQELDPHKPQFSNLQVVGKKYIERDMVNRLDLSQVSVPTIDDDSGTREQQPIIIDRPPMTGPSLLFDGHPAVWTGNGFSHQEEMETEARVTFECNATERVMSTLDIVNNGTTVIYYNWKSLPSTNPFDVVNSKSQRFYFNTSGGVILPGDSMKVPFIFKSPNAGIFTDQWQFETKPVLCGGAALIVTLRGVALKEDHYEKDRDEIEADLGYRQAAQIITQILDTLVEGIRTPDRPGSPIDAYITEEEVFRRHNPKLVFHHHISDDMKALYLEVHPEEERTWREWDQSVETITGIILEKTQNEELNCEESELLLERLNKAVQLASYPHFTPVQQRMYNIGFELLSDTVDTMIDHSVRLRASMGLPSKENEEFPDDIGVDKKKSQEAKKTPPKAGKDVSKSPEKKGGKDSKSPGKVSSKTPIQTKISPSRAEMTSTTPVGINQDSSLSLSDVSKFVVEDNGLESCYKKKLYALTYALISKCTDQMIDLFEEIQ